MTQNIFEDLQNKREQVKEFVKKALDKKWIEKNQYDEITTKIDRDTLTIGVIGQMKCGKSTFLNAFLFNDEVLPAATTPMTASLAVITYGNSKRIKVEFYSHDEWEEIKLQAEQTYDEMEDDLQGIQRIKAAKELVDKSCAIQSELDNLLGTESEDDIEKLIEYVGANGKYTSITKSVTIYYPEEWLKGVEIVDTPGFNDPIVSREKRTKEFLKKADAVVMLLYAGRAFDATDRDILFNKVNSVGIGKILIGINKYDLNYAKGETIEEIKTQVREEIKKACKAYKNSNVSELLEGLEPIPFSSNMALMAKMPLQKIRDDENLMFYWKKACNAFEISTQKEMLDKSLIKNLENGIRDIIQKSKNEILLKKPLSSILQEGLNRTKQAEIEELKYKKLVDNLSLPDDEIKEKIEELEKAIRKIGRKIDNSIKVLDEKNSEIIDTGIEELEDLLDKCKNNIYNIIDSSKSEEKAVFKTNQEIETLIDRTIPRKIKQIEKKIKKHIETVKNEFASDIGSLLYKHIEDSEEIIDTFLKKRIKLDKESTGTSSNENETNSEEEGNSVFWDFVGNVLSIPFVPFVMVGKTTEKVIQKVRDLTGSYKKDLKNSVCDLFKSASFDDEARNFQLNSDKYKKLLQTDALTVFLEDMEKKLKNVINDKDKKEQNLAEAKRLLSESQDVKSNLTAELEEMKKDCPTI